jgi:hypothetical protein
MARQRPEMDRLAASNPTMAHIVHSLATTTPRVAVAIGCLLVLFLHVFTHIAQAILVRGYTPGVIGAVLVVLPGSRRSNRPDDRR